MKKLLLLLLLVPMVSFGQTETTIEKKISGTYPKWELMASHVCRRSFCTNLYGTLPTPLIMSIYTHSSEKMLINYIGKNSLDFAQQIADFYTLQALRDKKKPQLNLIKNTSSHG